MPEEPTVEIGDLLNRRTDLSTFIVHLTRDAGGASAKDNLKSILAGGTIEARKAMGWLGTGVHGLTVAERAGMKVVCFSEVPLEHVYSLFAAIARRGIKLKPYGVAFTKAAARGRGANPVWYVNQSAGFTWQIAPALDQLREAGRTHPAGFAASPAAQILPFFESMGTWSAISRKEFWWEREWRQLGNFTFGRHEIALVLAPVADHAEFEAMGYPNVIDPSWSLERMLAKLLGLPDHLTSIF
jgi:Protein of unknown function (DUF2743).